MKRVFWMGLGIAIGVIAVRKLNETRNLVGPEGLNRAVARVADGIAGFTEAVREGMNERETDLRSALGVDATEPAHRA